MSFQDNLRQFRNNLNISAKDFAAEIGIPYTKYIAYENKGVEPKYDTLCRIAAALHVSIDDLLGYEPDKISYWFALVRKAGLVVEIYPTTLDIIISTPWGGAESFTPSRFSAIMQTIEAEIKTRYNDAQEQALITAVKYAFASPINEIPQDTPDTKKSPTE